MFIWQYIDLPENEVIKIQNEFRLQLPNNDLFFQSVNIGITEFCSMPLESAILIQVAPKAGIHHTGIHTDINPSELALNIPLENCDDSITSFWETFKPLEIRETPNKLFYNYYDPNHCRKIAEFKLTKPVIFNSVIAHNVSNPTDKWRRAISLRFKTAPWHLISEA